MEYLLYFVVAALLLVPMFLLVSLKKVKDNQARLDWMAAQRFVTLRIEVPKNNDKKPLAAEQMFASIHGIYSDTALYQSHLSFEIVAEDKSIQFYVHVPVQIKEFVEGQIYAQYPTVEINEVEDYIKTELAQETNFTGCEILMTKPDVYPIKLFDSFEVDPLSGITSVMGKLAPGERLWLQLMIRPVGDEWQNKGTSIVNAVRAGKKQGGKGILQTITGGTVSALKMIAAQAVNPGAEVAAADNTVKLPSTVEEALKGIEQKITKLGFETKIRILALAKDETTANVKCQNLAAAFKQYNTTNLNGFKIGPLHHNDFDFWQSFKEREYLEKGNIFNISELASFYHLPHESVSTPNIVWSGAKKGEPPANLPLTETTPAGELTILGMTNFRNVYREFGIRRDDRRRHIYIVGKSGTGKSTLIENMATDDVVSGKGVIIVDPHGELADKVIACTPDDRIKDVIVFDPSDRSFPIAFNLLESVDDDFKGMVASGFVGIFKKIFGDSWGPRLEHILRNTVLALLDSQNSTMLDIPKMLTDTRFRDKIVEQVKDPVIRDFWVNEFAQYDTKFRTEAVSPILNKVGQFLATATIRNIVGQPHSRINIREIMDQEKILIVNLSRGKIGEDNSALLGAMMITKIQLAAMSRADVTVDKRPDTYLYVDEFQNFATDSFAVILSEARKYNLCLTMANQYVEQMPEEVRSAVFGNAGTIICFRVGGTDAQFLVREFEPVFDANDLVNLDRYTIYIKMLIDGIAPPAFSAKTLPPVQQLTGNSEKIIQFTHEHYASSRAAVEDQIAGRTEEDIAALKAEAEAFRKGGLGAIMEQRGMTPKAEPAVVSSPEPVRAPIEPPKVAEKPVEAPTQIKDETPAPLEDEKKPESNSAETAEKKKKIFRYQNIIGDKVYKEQTSRGGVKWFIGEDIDLDKYQETGVEITEDAKKAIELAKKVATKGETEKEKEEPHDHNKSGHGHHNEINPAKKTEDEHPSKEEAKPSDKESEPKQEFQAESTSNEATLKHQSEATQPQDSHNATLSNIPSNAVPDKPEDKPRTLSNQSSSAASVLSDGEEIELP